MTGTTEEQTVQQSPNLNALAQVIDWKIIRSTLKLGIPMALADSYPYVMLSLPFIINKVHHGDLHWSAATSLIISSVDVVLVTCASNLFALRTIGSKLYGQYNDPNSSLVDKEKASKEINRLFRNGIRILVGIVPISVGGLLLVGDAAEILGENEKTAQYAKEFLAPYACLVIPPILLSMLADQMLSNAQFITPMIASPVNLVLGLSSAYALGMYGPDLVRGNRGVLLGISYIAYITAAIYCGFIFFHPKFKPLQFHKGVADLFVKKAWMDDWDNFKEIIHIGCPLTVSIATEMLNGWLLQLLTARISTESQAAWSSGMMCSLASIPITLNVAIASLIMVRSTMGHPRHIFPRSLNGLIASAMVGAVVPLLFGLYPELSIKLNNPDEKTRQIILQITPIIALTTYLNTFCYALLFQLRGLDYFWKTTAIRATGIAFGLLTASILSSTSLQARGVTLGDTFGKVVLLSFALVVYIQKFKPYYYQSIEPEVNQGNLPNLDPLGLPAIELSEIPPQLVVDRPGMASNGLQADNNLGRARGGLARWGVFGHSASITTTAVPSSNNSPAPALSVGSPAAPSP